ncbi:helix-turn-helix domain-containing protein [Streptomyces sp. NPDC057654]|uniref:helix-turn-helix domain-containing protein n=1 Tax=Streptomyces sp. NPDC057654 TaxID=3346196 RepID=UPI0036B2F28C
MDADFADRELAYQIAQAVYERRTELGWSQRELAERSGMKQPHVSRLESARRMPQLDVLRRVAEAMGTDLVVTFASQPSQPEDAPARSGAPTEGDLIS